MPFFKCSKFNKEFNRKSNFDYHIKNKIRPCTSNIFINVPIHTEAIPKHTDFVPIHTDFVPIHTNDYKKIIESKIPSINEIILDDIEKLVNKNVLVNENNNTCMYCNITFVQKSSLNRHLKDRCKSKIYFDELEKLKSKFESVINNNNSLLKENEKLKKENEELKNTNVPSHIINNNTTNNNNLKNNQINNGTINHNNLNVQLVQFGNENIDDLDIKEALNVYLKSTGGNILSNILKFVNLNEKYPQNHNICMSDLSRELVKIFNGKKFIVRKFKNAKGDILGKVINNTYKIVDKIENDDTIKKTPDVKSKIKINNVSLKLIDGCSAEDIVRDEIKEKNNLLKDNEILLIEDDDDDDNEEKEERDFNLEEQLRIEHLESKRQGLQEITIERLKEELYNGKT